jgi:predicted ester cyclase
VLHLPAADLDFEQLRGYFAALRAAFPDLAIRRAIIVGEGRYLAARTIFSGTFANVFTQSPAGALQPTGRRVEWEVMNIFRYDEQGRLAEEWLQTDFNTFLEKLGRLRDLPKRSGDQGVRTGIKNPANGGARQGIEKLASRKH